MTRTITWKRIFIVLLVAFFLLFVIQSPTESAGVTRDIFIWIGNAAERLGRAFADFFAALF